MNTPWHFVPDSFFMMADSFFIMADSYKLGVDSYISNDRSVENNESGLSNNESAIIKNDLFGGFIINCGWFIYYHGGFNKECGEVMKNTWISHERKWIRQKKDTFGSVSTCLKEVTYCFF